MILTSKWHSPDNSSSQEGEAKCYPVRQRKPGDVQDHFNYDQLASPAGFGGLALPDWCRRSVETIADSTNDAVFTISQRPQISCLSS